MQSILRATCDTKGYWVCALLAPHHQVFWRPLWRVYFPGNLSRLETTANALRRGCCRRQRYVTGASAADLLVYYGRPYGQQVGYHGRVNMGPEPDIVIVASTQQSQPDAAHSWLRQFIAELAVNQQSLFVANVSYVIITEGHLLNNHRQSL